MKTLKILTLSLLLAIGSIATANDNILSAVENIEVSPEGDGVLMINAGIDGNLDGSVLGGCPTCKSTGGIEVSVLDHKGKVYISTTVNVGQNFKLYTANLPRGKYRVAAKQNGKTKVVYKFIK